MFLWSSIDWISYATGSPPPSSPSSKKWAESTKTSVITLSYSVTNSFSVLMREVPPILLLFVVSFKTFLCAL